MTIQGFETREQVLATLAALRMERPRSEAHAASIAASIAVFQKEADRFEREETARIKAENKARLEQAKAAASSLR